MEIKTYQLTLNTGSNGNDTQSTSTIQPNTATQSNAATQSNTATQSSAATQSTNTTQPSSKGAVTTLNTLLFLLLAVILGF
jgi:hypothetical protein